MILEILPAHVAAEAIDEEAVLAARDTGGAEATLAITAAATTSNLNLDAGA